MGQFHNTYVNRSQRARSDNPQAKHIWRFYSDPVHRWRWQRLAFDGSVVEYSKSAYAQYETCLANAREQGYVYSPSLTTKTEKMAPQVRRSYIRLTTNRQKLVSRMVVEDVEQREDTPQDDAPAEHPDEFFSLESRSGSTAAG